MQEIINEMDFSTGWWYPVALGILLLFFVIVMPKIITWREIYLTFGFIAGIVWVTDTVFAVWLNLFDIGDPGKRGIAEFFLYSIIPPCFAILYLNYYKENQKLQFTLLFSAISGMAEWLSVAVGLMKPTHWNTLFSLPVYFVVYYFFLPMHLNMMDQVRFGERRKPVH
jgi:hypothetical protein